MGTDGAAGVVVAGAAMAAAPGGPPAGMRGGIVALGEDVAGFAGAAAAGVGVATGGAAAAAAAAATGTGSAGRVVPHWTQNLAPGCVS
jgi:hypothetical protein